MSPVPAMPSANPRRSILGRRRRETVLTDLPDDVLLRILSAALSLRTHGHVSQRSIARFHRHAPVLAQLSRRFLSLMRALVVSVHAFSPRDQPWARSMVVFARDSLRALHIAHAPVRPRPRCDSLPLLLAEARPPLRELALAGHASAPFEHVVAMLRAFPYLRELDIQCPRPMDVAAVARACTALVRLSLGPVSHVRDVDEMRRQFVNLVCSPVARKLRTLNIPWSCVTTEAFAKMATNCDSLERFGAEFGAMHWIRHRAFKASDKNDFYVDLCACAREQRLLFSAMLGAVVKGGRLKSFAVRTMDGIPATDLDLVFRTLPRLHDLDLLVGSSSKPTVFSHKSFALLTRSLGSTVRRLNVVGVSFTAAQVHQLATSFPHLSSLSLWMAENQRPPLDVFENFGPRIKHLSILCEWTADMCHAVGMHNTELESLFVVARSLPLSAVQATVLNNGATMREFRLFLNRKNLVVPPGSNGSGNIAVSVPLQGNAPKMAAEAETASFVLDAARVVAQACSANLEVLNISASGGGEKWFVDCSSIASELRRIAPRLWGVCDVDADRSGA
ncbi:unnamed protein product [Chondrus crispus]|uniref:F-box domain-containing protein n=1 Tax=Chondrus crispus TaxID=2769 RepID=R7QRX9_CHOCR|nr:unnamed protein product [Chondrus crispus]CDF40889.1 unnamed protein product [Chondrus crispus]|eukprot:XP_005711183.1 unnamed protein product [Chondrus crispus]